MNENKVRECHAGFKPTYKTINYNQTRLINCHYRLTAEDITFDQILPGCISEKNCH